MNESNQTTIRCRTINQELPCCLCILCKRHRGETKKEIIFGVTVAWESSLYRFPPFDATAWHTHIPSVIETYERNEKGRSPILRVWESLREGEIVMVGVHCHSMKMVK